MANLPAGAVIVLTAASFFFFSLVFGTAGGLLRAAVDRLRLSRKVMRENLLRELYEWQESAISGRDAGSGLSKEGSPRLEDLLHLRSWSARSLKRGLRQMVRNRWLTLGDGGRYAFTAQGSELARGVVRKHRLWEAYLINYADTAPGQVDWGADTIEHVLDERIISQLEAGLPEMAPLQIPESPHELRRQSAEENGNIYRVQSLKSQV